MSSSLINDGAAAMAGLARIRSGVVTIAFVLASLGASGPAVATWYTLQAIPLPPGALGLQANDIADDGEVVGLVTLASGSAGFAYPGGQQGGQVILLAAPVDQVVWGATAVDATGRIVGGTVSALGIPKAALWASATDLAPVVLESGGGPDANVYATGINGAGIVSGYFTGSGSGQASSWRAVKWTPDGNRMRQGVLVTGVAPLPVGVFHAAYGLNDLGQIVGTGAWVGDPALPSLQAAIRWEANEAAVELATPAGVDAFPRSTAWAINESGVSVGELVTNVGEPHALRWNAAGAVTNLGVAPGFTGSRAVDLNDAGVIVGSLTTANGSSAAVYENGAWIDLNARLVGAPGWHLVSAAGINASGQIIGQAAVGGQTRAVILTPTTTPANVPTTSFRGVFGLSLLLLGAGGVALHRSGHRTEPA